MIQCPEAHLFCGSCVTTYASTRLGEQKPDLPCMDASGCKLNFPDSELRRILPVKLLGLYERVRQRRDLEAAALEGLEECPFCEYRVVMDVDIEVDKLFRCQNEECGKVSCRKCKKEVCRFYPRFFEGRCIYDSSPRIIYQRVVKVSST